MKILKRIGVGLLIVIVLVIIALFCLARSFTPLEESKRNISTTNIKMMVDVVDVVNRTPIVRTYTKEEYDQFNDKKRKKIKDVVDGNIEGDIPALVIDEGIGILKFRFEDDTKADRKLNLDSTPQIQISALYSQDEPEIFEGILTKEKDVFLYEITRFFDDDEADCYDKGCAESLYIEIAFETEGVEYISLFAINTIEYK